MTTTTAEPALLDVRDGVAELTLNRPHVGNSVNLAMVGRLESLLEELESHDDLSAVVVRGAGERFFCSGGDLDEYSSLDAADARRLSLRMQRLLAQLSRLPAVTVAALSGHVVGGGLEVALACDLRVADATARLVRPEVGMGLLPPWGGLSRMRELLGRTATLRVLLLENRMDAHRALEVGLVDVVAGASAVAEATRLAGAVGQLPRPSVLAAGQLLDRDATAEEVADTFGRLWSGEHHRTTQQRWRDRRSGPTGPDVGVTPSDGNTGMTNHEARQGGRDQ